MKKKKRQVNMTKRDAASLGSGGGGFALLDRGAVEDEAQLNEAKGRQLGQQRFQRCPCGLEGRGDGQEQLHGEGIEAVHVAAVGDTAKFGANGRGKVHELSGGSFLDIGLGGGKAQGAGGVAQHVFVV